MLDSTNLAYTIDCDDPAILGPWFVNITRKLMTADSRYQIGRFQICPQTDEEIKLLTEPMKHALYVTLNQENVLEWAKLLTDLSAELEHAEL